MKFNITKFIFKMGTKFEFKYKKNYYYIFYYILLLLHKIIFKNY